MEEIIQQVIGLAIIGWLFYKGYLKFLFGEWHMKRKDRQQ
jgi:hypothetical protein